MEPAPPSCCPKCSQPGEPGEDGFAHADPDAAVVCDVLYGGGMLRSLLEPEGEGGTA
jgi:hypothetical protein